MFDLDDTLIVEAATAQQAFQIAAGVVPGVDPEKLAETARQTATELWRQSPHLEMGRELGIASWEAMWATFEGGHPRLDDVSAWVTSYRRSVWEQALERCGADTSTAPDAADAYIESQRAGHPVIPGAIDLLRRLRQDGRALGLLTNGPPDIQRLKLAQLGVADLFAAVVISGEAGVGKPDPAVFALVLDQMGASAEDAVMIGDSWSRDIEGAARIGMRSIWISQGRDAPGEVPGVSIVTTTPDAAQLLGC